MIRHLMLVGAWVACMATAWAQGQSAPASAPVGPDEVYIPYKNLRDTIEKHGRGVFLPYEEFQRLWDAANHVSAPATGTQVTAAIGRVSYEGSVNDETATITARVEFDVLTDEWVTLDLRLKDVAIRSAKYRSVMGRTADLPAPLLQTAASGHQLIVRGRGAYVLELEFLRNLELQPGRTRFSFDPIRAPIATLDLTVPVDGAEIAVEPILAATTQPVATQPSGKPGGSTRIKAFIAPVDRLSLTWTARTELASGMAGVIEAEQRHVVSMTSSNVVDRIEVNYAIRHAPRDRFEIAIPVGWRVLGLTAAGLQSWTVRENAASPVLAVRLYEPQREKFSAVIELERPVSGDEWTLAVPIVRTSGAARDAGVIAIRQPDGFKLRLASRDAMVQIDVGELPDNMRENIAFAMRFASPQASLSFAASRILPKLSLRSRQLLSIDDQIVQLAAELDYTAEAAGVFGVRVRLPEGWDVLDVGPGDLIEDRRIEGDGESRTMAISLRRKVTGPFRVNITAQRPRAADASRETLSALDAVDAIGGTYAGAIIIAAKDHLDLKVTSSSGVRPRPLNELAGRFAANYLADAGYPRIMGFEFTDRQRQAASAPASAPIVREPLRVDLAVERKKTRLTAMVGTLLELSDSQTRYDATIQYDVQYADIDEVRFKVPVSLREDQLNISGDNIREKRVVPVPSDTQWRHWLITLARPARGAIIVNVKWDATRTASQPGEAGLSIPEIVPEGALEHSDGQVIVRASENFQVDVAKLENARPIDITEIKSAAHRDRASLAFAYDTPGFTLTLTATRQEFQEVAQLVIDRVLIEQTLSRAGDVTTRAAYVVQTNAQPTVRLTLPTGAKLLSHAWVDGRAVVPQRPAGSTQVVLIPLTGGAEPNRRSTIEVMYAMTGSSGALSAPTFDAKTPIQETRWLVWIPSDLEPIWHDTSFIPINADWFGSLTSSRGDAAQQSRWLTNGSALSGMLATEGTPLLFRKLGGADLLSITTVSRTVWRVCANGALILLVLAGLRMSWRRRAGIVLLVLICAALIAAVNPLPVSQFVAFGSWGFLAIAAAWLGQAALVQIPAWWATRRGDWTVVSPPPAAVASTTESKAVDNV